MDARLHTSIKDEHNALDKLDRSIILANATSMLERYTKMFDEAHLNLHVKTVGGKNLVHVAALLDTDRGRHNTEAQGFNIEEAVNTCLENIRLQLAKRADRLQDRRQMGTVG